MDFPQMPVGFSMNARWMYVDVGSLPVDVNGFPMYARWMLDGCSLDVR